AALTLFQAVGDRLGEANVLAALSRLMLDSNPPQSAQLLQEALALRESINDRYSMGADLGNYGIALLQHGRNAEALPYLERARAIFAQQGIEEMVPQVDALIAQAQGSGGGPDMGAVLREFEPLLRAIAAVANGDDAPPQDVTETLAHLEQQGWMLREPVERIWAGERNRTALVAGLDDQDAALIDQVLALIASPN
ncbi:tetratricopeptide repeat protein, partial [Candidatus Chloroploca sp. M-50]